MGGAPSGGGVIMKSSARAKPWRDVSFEDQASGSFLLGGKQEKKGAGFIGQLTTFSMGYRTPISATLFET